MSRTVTLADLVSRTLTRAGLPAYTQKIDTTTGGWLEAEINQSATGLYDKILLAWGEDYFGTSNALTTGIGKWNNNAPSDFYRILGLDWVQSSGALVTLQPLDWSKRAEYTNQTWSARTPVYHLQRDIIYWYPTPTSVESVTLNYVPTLATLDGSTDLEGINGWDEFVVLDAAIKCRESCRMDTTTLMADRDRAEARIIAMAPRRDIRATAKVSRRRSRAWAVRYL